MFTNTASGLAITFALALVVYPHTGGISGVQRVADQQQTSSTAQQTQAQAQSPNSATAPSSTDATKQHIDGGGVSWDPKTGAAWRKEVGLPPVKE
jgi:hypothetical protein